MSKENTIHFRVAGKDDLIVEEGKNWLYDYMFLSSFKKDNPNYCVDVYVDVEENELKALDAIKKAYENKAKKGEL